MTDKLGWMSPEKVKELIQDEHNQHIKGEEKARREEREGIINQLQGIYNQAGDLRTMERELRDFLHELRFGSPSKEAKNDRG